MPAELNATQGSLLGLLHDGPRTGWDLLQTFQGGLARFWNVTPSHVYRELQALEGRGLIRAGAAGVRDRRPYTITRTGRSAFAAWLATEPRSEQIRFPLLLTLWFGGHLDPEVRTRFIASSRAEHVSRLDLYEQIDVPDEAMGAVVAFGVAYERAVIDWLDSL